MFTSTILSYQNRTIIKSEHRYNRKGIYQSVENFFLRLERDREINDLNQSLNDCVLAFGIAQNVDRDLRWNEQEQGKRRQNKHVGVEVPYVTGTAVAEYELASLRDYDFVEDEINQSVMNHDQYNLKEYARVQQPEMGRALNSQASDICSLSASEVLINLLMLTISIMVHISFYTLV